MYSATATDPDAGDAITYSLGSGKDNALLMIDSKSGAVVLNSSADYEAKNSYVFDVIATDKGSLSTSKTVTLSVSNVNEAPVIISSASASFDVATTVGSTVYTVQATDVDANDSLTYSLNPADSSFKIDSVTGIVTLNTALNSDPHSPGNPTSFEVIATDKGQLHSSKVVSVNLSASNVAPVISSANKTSIAENNLSGAQVYTVTASDGNAGDTLSFSLGKGHDSAKFSIDSHSGIVSLNESANFEAISSYIFDVIVTDSGLLSDSKTVALTITDVNEAPAMISATKAMVSENAPVSTVIYTAAATDPDALETLSYSLGAGKDNAQFNIDTKTGEVRLNTSADYEAKASYSFDVIVKDLAGLSDSKTVQLSVSDVAEYSTFVLGDAPVRQSGIGGQWAQAWTRSGFDITHKADYTNDNEAWSAVTLHGVSSQNLSGGDIYSGDLGVSAQSSATTTVKQEIDGKEALRIHETKVSHKVSVKLSNLLIKDDGTNFSESGLLRAFDAQGKLVGQQIFIADNAAGTKTVQLSVSSGFSSIEIVAGAVDTNGNFTYGAYSAANGGFGSAIYTDGVGKLHGSDFLVDAIEYSVLITGTPPLPLVA